MDFRNILKSIVIGGIFLIPFVPLVVFYSLFFPFITGKVFAFRIIVEVIFVAWVLLAILDREYLPKKSWLLGSVVFFLVALLISDLFGVEPYLSFWSVFERMEGFLTLLHLGLFFIVASSVFNEIWWKRFFHTSLAVSVIVSIYSVLQLLGFITINQGGVRVDGTLGNAIYLAIYLLFHVFIALFYFFRSVNIYKYLYLPVIALEVSIIYFTASRGVILGLIGGLLVSFFLTFILERQRKSLRKVSAAVLLTLALLIVGFLFIRDSSFVKNNAVLSRFSELSINEIKSQGRYYIWPMAIEGFKDRPILGHGQENFMYIFNRHYNPALFNQEPWFDRAHNIFLDWLVAGGIIGLTAYLAIIFFLFFTLWRSPNFSTIDKSIISGLLAGYLFQAIFVFDNITSYIMFFSVVAFVLTLSGSNSKFDWFTRFNFNENRVKAIMTPVAISILVISIYFLNIKPLLANRSIIVAIHPDTSLEASLNAFKKVFDYNTFGSSEALLQLMSRTVQIIESKTVPDNIKESHFRLTQEQIELQTNRFPKDTRLFLMAGSFYNRINLYNEALKYLNVAKELSPQRQDIYLEIGTSYFFMQETGKAIENFEHAINLEPRNPEGIIRYIITYLYSGNLEKAESLLQKLSPDIFYSDNRILNALISAGQYEKALDIWQTRVENEPRNVTNRQSLVATYLKLGQWNNAIAEIEKIMEISPDFKEFGEQAISEIRAGRGHELLTE